MSAGRDRAPMNPVYWAAGIALGARMRKKPELRQRRRIAAAVLDKLIEEATVDCYNESEQGSGLYTMLEENLVLPFGGQ